jgi:hypothetical protein
MCVWNKQINGKQCTICFHVDDCKISHLSKEVVDHIIEWLRRDYKSIFEDGSGKMKVNQGKVHNYLGMTLDFSVDQEVKIFMVDYVKKVIAAWDKASKHPMMVSNSSNRKESGKEKCALLQKICSRWTKT